MDGKPCMSPVAIKPNGRRAKRCRWHGGLSTGPRTREGKARCALNLPSVRAALCPATGQADRGAPPVA